MDDRVLKASEQLKRNSYLQKTDDVQKNTAAAATYFINNKDDLKYLLTSYKMYERVSIMINHLARLFGELDQSKITRILLKHGIISYNTLFFIVYIVPITLMVLIIGLCIYLKIVGYIVPGACFLYIVLTIIVTIAILCINESIANSHITLYRISSYYRHKGKPSKSLD